MGSPTYEVTEAEPAQFDEQELEKHLQRVAQSAQFMRAETLRRLLLYLWVHRDEDISEYAVATDALGRRVDFDPKTDASVRVQISRLRRKLKDFYETEGAYEAYMLHIPMGTHALTILNGASEPLPLTIAPAEETPFSVTRLVQPSLVLLCIALSLLSSWLLWDRHEKGKVGQRAMVAPTSFWKSFIGVGTPVKIILPTPVFFTYPKLPKLHVRDVDINDFQTWPSSNVNL
jgi:hypothetical protein